MVPQLLSEEESGAGPPPPVKGDVVVLDGITYVVENVRPDGTVHVRSGKTTRFLTKAEYDAALAGETGEAAETAEPGAGNQDRIEEPGAADGPDPLIAAALDTHDERLRGVPGLTFKERDRARDQLRGLASQGGLTAEALRRGGDPAAQAAAIAGDFAASYLAEINVARDKVAKSQAEEMRTLAKDARKNLQESVREGLFQTLAEIAALDAPFSNEAKAIAEMVWSGISRDGVDEEIEELYVSLV